jgi:hypothetical protein
MQPENEVTRLCWGSAGAIAVAHAREGIGTQNQALAPEQSTWLQSVPGFTD